MNDYVSYERLEVFQRAYKLALDIHKITRAFPKIEQYGGLADQLRRSSKSICANLAEGLSKKSSEAEECRFLSIALGSCEESRVWLKFANDLGYGETKFIDEGRQEYGEISRMIFALIQRRKVA